MTQQFADTPSVTLEIAEPGRYARVGSPDPVPAPQAPGVSAEIGDRPVEPATGQRRGARGRFLQPPLAEKAEQIEANYRAAVADATSERQLLAAGVDYVRAGAATADRHGVTDPAVVAESVAVREAVAAVAAARQALTAAGNALIHALKTWSPEP